MKHLISASIILLLVSTIVFAGDEELAKFAPQKLKVGDEISITYNAGLKTAILKGVKEVTAEALILRSEGPPTLTEVSLKKSGQLWTGSFKLAEAKAQVLFLRFVSGDKTDDNSENVWDLLVYGSDGKEVKGAHMGRAQVQASGNYAGFKRAKDPAAAMNELKIERSLYPDNIGAIAMLWNLDMRANPGDETKQRILKELDELYAAQKDNQDNAAGLIGMYGRLGKKETTDSLQKMWIAKDSKGKIAENARLSEVYAERDPAKRAKLLEKFLVEFSPKADMLQNLKSTLSMFYMQAKNYDKAVEILEALPNPSGNMYNSLAWDIIEKGEKGPELEKAVRWAKKGIDVLKSGKEQKPPYMNSISWKKNQDMNLGMIADTYAFGLFKMGQTKEAENAYAEAVQLTEGKQGDINDRYVESIVANGNYRKVMKVCEEFILKGTLSDKMLESYKTAYVKVKGSDKGFDDVVNKAKNVAKEEARKKIMKERVNKPAVQFALKSMEGITVKLADLKGKVVVVDFWATWCGPCKASFPFLQKVYEKYKVNSNVMILTLNTWENETGTKREDLVKKFMADNKYTFPVLYDEGFVEKYGVEGIPTKFIIDKKGMIQFKSIGFDNGPKMVDEMTAEIEILLSDDFYSIK
jgi:thiol-disulfide isomerase/thioredoxin